MEINLNDPAEFTVENLKKLIASEDDTVNTQIRVTNDGYLFLSRVVGHEELSGILFRLESFCESCGNVGIEASNDEHWVNRLYKVIKDNWPNPVRSYIDIF